MHHRPTTFRARFAVRAALALLGCGALPALSALPALAAPTVAAPALRIVVPFAAGGSQDVIARTLATRAAAALGRPVIVENKAGAGGIVAAEQVTQAHDGATLLLATGGAITIAPLLQKLSYDPQRDLAPLVLVADTPMTIAVRAESPFHTLADALAEARRRPGAVAYASTGQGSVSHLAGALLAQAAGVDLLHVPYRGAAPAMTDVLGGQVALIVTSAASIEPMVAAGKARVLGTFSAARVPGLGDAPTVAEATGLKGLAVPVWIGVMAPTRVPPAHAAAVADALLTACRAPETREQFARSGALATCAGSAEFTRVLAEDRARWERVVRRGGIRVD